MFKRTLVAFLLIGLFFSVHAQETQKSMQKNTFFVELGGNGFFYSLNYDRILLDYSTWRISGRIGGMYLPGLFDTNRHMIGLPVEVSYWTGKGNHHFELGLGFTPIYDRYSLKENSSEDLVMIGVARIGYRYQKREGGVFYKAGFTPLHGTIYDLVYRERSRNSNFTYPMIGLAIGYTLKR